MYDNPFLYADGTAKKEDLDRIEQKFHVKISQNYGWRIYHIPIGKKGAA